MLVSWNTTNACNLFCQHCYRESGAKAEEELSFEEGKKLIDEIAAAGFKIMIFSGGEPLMRDDIYELIEYAARSGLRPVLGSNGTLIDGSAARALKKAGALAVGISLDSAKPAEHDRFRNSPGSWQAAVNGMKACLEAGLPFQVHTTVMEWNAGEVEELTDLAVQKGARGHHIFFMVPTGRAVNIEAETLRAEQYEQLLQRIMLKQGQVDIELKPTCAPQFMRIARQMGINTRFSRGCLAGTAYCIISPRGDVQPCAYLNIPLGNVRTTPFNQIWRENETLQRLRTLNYSGSCGRCEYKKICGGCRARANYYHGDYMAEEPWCLYGARKG
ncbi:putative heme d1 biosynthesis radical SAM protein NirJ2 [Desulfotruncus alcoholivorax]|uniref:putative heme d1 biosynthesis radical SAM protein NirJ2 n=1 Tax=Desulfotruncus alcoholivorax TaxID=265477 RepID=UPI000428025E|nr:putative heme d1 biosynthesis radical SAM protein NirJ2 [Desulfotruncus alcoholivorax]